MRKQLFHPATVIALIALFVACGGISVASTALRAAFVSNSDKVDGIHASRKAKPNTLLPLNKSGKLPASVLTIKSGPMGPRGPRGTPATGAKGDTSQGGRVIPVPRDRKVTRVRPEERATGATGATGATVRLVQKGRPAPPGRRVPAASSTCVERHEHRRAGRQHPRDADLDRVSGHRDPVVRGGGLGYPGTHRSRRRTARPTRMRTSLCALTTAAGTSVGLGWTDHLVETGSASGLTIPISLTSGFNGYGTFKVGLCASTKRLQTRGSGATTSPPSCTRTARNRPLS